MELVTVNLGNPAHNVTTLQRRAQMRRLARRRSAVVVTQEARPGLFVPLGYRAMPALPPGAAEDRIIVRKGLRVLAHGYAAQIHDGIEHVWPARNIPFVALDDEPGPLYVIGLHLESKIETRGVLTAMGDRKVVTLRHIDAVAEFAEWVHARGARAVVLGDTNVDAYADRRVRQAGFPTRRFAAAGLIEHLPPRASGTLGSRRVDRVFATEGMRVSVRDLARHAPYDHQPVAATIH